MRTVAMAAAATVAIPAALATVPAHADDRASRPGAAWLNGELTKGLVVDTQFNFADYGLSIDTALALASAGKDKQAAKVTKAVASQVSSYTTGADFGSTDVYAGATAKAAVLALDQGRKPTAFGGVDLVAQLEGLVQRSGRIADRSDFGDFANVVGQSYAAWSLSAVGSPVAKRSVRFLLSQQCSKGFFRLDFSGDTLDESCDNAVKSARQPDTDATSHAVIALSQVEGGKAAKAVEAATRWLTKRQGSDGSFGGGPSTEAPNTNSTGLAGTALAAAGDEARAARAAAYVRSFQVVAVTGCPSKLDDDAGAIAYDKAAWRTGERQGLTDESRGQWRRATAQALPVLQWAPGTDRALGISGRPVTNGVRLTITGVAPGERVCLIGGGDRQWVVGRSRTTSVTVATNGVYRIVNGAGASAQVRVPLG